MSDDLAKRIKSLLQIQRGHQQEIEGLKRALDKRDAEITALKAQVVGARDAALEEAAALCVSKSETPMDVREPEYYTALGYELAADAIRSLKSSAQSV